MIKIFQALLDEYAPITELTLCVVLYLPVDSTELLDALYLFNPHPAAACSSFNKNGRPFQALVALNIKEVLGNFLCLHFIINGAVRSRYGRYAQLVGNSLRVDFVTKIFDYLPVGTDEAQRPVTDDYPSGETIVLGKKTISRVDGCT